jgi:hypothetical protein
MFRTQQQSAVGGWISSLFLIVVTASLPHYKPVDGPQPAA